MTGGPARSPLFPTQTLSRSCAAGGSSLAVAPAVGGPVVTVPGVTGWAYSPAWLPDAFTLVFARAEADFSKDRKSTRLNSSHANISHAVFCLKKKNLNISHAT